MKIIITGVHGFVGKNLADNLSKYHTIYGLSTNSKPVHGVSQIFTWDNINQIPKADVIIHLAAIAHDINNKVDAKEYFDVNVGLTQKIYDYFLSSSISKFIFFSSIKAISNSLNNEILLESTPASPSGPYGMSKRAAEEYILNNTPDSEKTAIILRPSMIHGLGNKGNLNLLYNYVKKGLPWPLGKFENKRSFLSIPNLIYLINKIIDSEINNGVYNIADDEPLSTNNIVNIISSILGSKTRIYKIPKNVIYLMAKTGNLFSNTFNEYKLEKLTENYIVSNTKIKDALSIKSLPVSAQEGIEQSIKYLASSEAIDSATNSFNI